MKPTLGPSSTVQNGMATTIADMSISAGIVDYDKGSQLVRDSGHCCFLFSKVTEPLVRRQPVPRPLVPLQ